MGSNEKHKPFVIKHLQKKMLSMRFKRQLKYSKKKNMYLFNNKKSVLKALNALEQMRLNLII
uniref:Uncharacterized protein n=1 Tax=viral metagenome TaxID=1070528 RepID=A0A6C0B606_9ZZZZ